MQVNIDLSFDELEYLKAAARLRWTKKGELVVRLVHKLLEDQLILAVLDDGDRTPPAGALKRKH